MTKPYQIEIFDRSFNFKYNYLVDASDFEYSEDALDPEKNTVEIPKDASLKIQPNVNNGSANTVAISDFIRIVGNGDEFTGVITAVIEDDKYIQITYTDLLALFNHEVVVAVDDIKATNIENYIKTLLVEEFVNNGDSGQIISNLNITTSSTTTGVLDYVDTTEVYVVINLLNDLIVSAFQKYLIFTDVDIDISNKAVNVNIGVISTSTQVIEADLPDVVEKEFTIRQSNSDVNKLTLVDMKDYALTPYTYYLHASDYSYDRNNTDRILPVTNSVITFDSDSVTEDEYMAIANTNTATFNKYVAIERDLNANETSLLTTAMNNLLLYYRIGKTDNEWSEIAQTALDEYMKPICENYAGHPFAYLSPEKWDDVTQTNRVTWSVVTNGVVVHRSDVGFIVTSAKPTVITDPYFVFGSASSNFYRNESQSTLPINFKTHESYHQNTAHVELKIPFSVNVACIEASEERLFYGNISGYVAIPLSVSLSNQLLQNYKESESFKRDFVAYKTRMFNAVLDGLAAKTFKASKYNNRISLTVNKDDEQIKPMKMKMGQAVQIIHDGTVYNSILTARNVSRGQVELIFGTIRLELTKYLKGRY